MTLVTEKSFSLITNDVVKYVKYVEERAGKFSWKVKNA